MADPANRKNWLGRAVDTLANTETNPLALAWRMLPPEARKAYSSLPSAIGELSPGAAIRDTVQASGETANAAMQGRGWDAAGGAANMLAAAAGVVPGGRAAGKGLTYWSDLSKTKHAVPVEEMRATRTSVGDMLPRNTISPESLQGSILIPAVGDRTQAGGLLTHINDASLAKPVTLEGGPDFMRASANQSSDGSVWASDKPVIGRLANYTRELGQTGNPLNLVYSAMGARSGDASHMMADALLQQMPGAQVTKKAAKEFDSSLRKQLPDWPGVNSPEARAYLINTTMDKRKQFVELFSLAEHQAKGFPDVASTRFAITDPAFVGQPTGVSGHSIARLDPAGKVIPNPQVPHTTYSTQLGGQGYLGGMEKPIPREVMFPDFYAARRAANQPKLADDRSFSMSNVSQQANQQWVDTVSNYLRGQK